MPIVKHTPRPIERETVASATTRALRDMILSGQIAEGEQLRQDALAAAYGVSRIPLREALRQLEAEGLVSFYPHRGAVVSTLSLAEIEELFEIRALIEPDLCRRAIRRLTKDDLDRAGEILDIARESFRSRDVGRWGGAQLEVSLDPLCAGGSTALDGRDREAQYQH